MVLIGYGSPLVTMAKSSRIDDIYESEEEEERRYTQRMKEEKHIKVKLRTPLKGFRTKLMSKNASTLQSYFTTPMRLNNLDTSQTNDTFK